MSKILFLLCHYGASSVDCSIRLPQKVKGPEYFLKCMIYVVDHNLRHRKYLVLWH